jgi:hypothetical protein
VAIVVAALAGPIVVTQSRLRTWNARTARAVIVDVSASMNLSPGAGGTLATQARDAGAAEARTATYARVFEVQDLGTGLDRAATWLANSPPARREIVVLSDFQRGAIGSDIAAHLPVSIGLKLVPIGRPLSHVAVSGLETLGAPGVAQRHQNVEVHPESTTVTFDKSEVAPTGGVRFVNALPAEQSSLLRAVAIAGTPAGSAEQPIAFVFDADKHPGALDGLTPVRERWMLQAILRLNASSTLSSPLRTGAKDRELVIGVPSPASSFAAASVVRAALVARHSTDDYSEREIARTSDAALSALNRPSGPVEREAWRAAESTDARWCWLIALVLLAIEQWLRARPVARRSQEVTRAAA